MSANCCAHPAMYTKTPCNDSGAKCEHWAECSYTTAWRRGDAADGSTIWANDRMNVHDRTCSGIARAASGIKVDSTYFSGGTKAARSVYTAKPVDLKTMTDDERELRRGIDAALAEDAKCRQPGVTEGIYGLADLAPHTGWPTNVGVPAVVPRPGGEPFAVAKTDAEFAARLGTRCAAVASLPFAEIGVVLAGGAASALVMREGNVAERFHDDYDLFLVGHETEAEALAAIVKIGDHLAAKWADGEHTWGVDPTTVHRTEKCVTFYGGGATVQVILRRHSTLAEVIHSFDLGSSAFAYDGTRVHMTALGKLAAERGVNVLNLAARRASYERRIVRYFGRGFGIVLPHLDVKALADLGGRLPYLYVSRDDDVPCANPCLIHAYSLSATRPGYANWGQRVGAAPAPAAAEAEPAEESSYSAYKVRYGNQNAIETRNIKVLGGADPRSDALCAVATWETGMDPSKLEPSVKADMIARDIRYCFRGARVDTEKLIKILGVGPATGLTIAFMTGGAVDDGIVRQFAEEIAARLNAKAKIPFTIGGVEAGTNLIGPFNARPMDGAAWYGRAMFGALGCMEAPAAAQ